MTTMGIYEIVNLYDGKATAYVGSSSNIKKRKLAHQNALKRGDHDNEHLQRAWDKYTERAFEFGIIEEINDETQLLEREQYWLDRYFEMPGSIYNIAKDAVAPMRGHTFSADHRHKLRIALRGNTNTLGFHPSIGTRQKMSAAQKGPNNGFYGKTHSEESLRIMRQKKIGRNHPNWGKAQSQEMRRKCSHTLMGHKLSVETKRAIGKANAHNYPALRHSETGRIIPAGRNLRALCRRHGFSMRGICRLLHGERPHYKGWVIDG